MNGQALRIFAQVPNRRSLTRPDRSPRPALELVHDEGAPLHAPVGPPIPAEPAIETPIEVTIEAATEPRIECAAEPRLLASLASPQQYGETIDMAYRRKERELGDVFCSLTRIEALSLHKRLSDPRDDDELAKRFGRLVVERRVRLLAALARVR